MLVLMKTTMAGPDLVASPGQKVEVSPEIGRDLVRGGFAVVVETAAMEAPEKAQMPRPTTRRGKGK